MNNSKSIVFILPPKEQAELFEKFSNAKIDAHMQDSNLGDDLLGFDAEGVRNIIVAIGGTGIITAITQILVTYLKERKKTIAIRKKDGDLRVVANNFNAEELEVILNNLNESDTIWFISHRIEVSEVTELLEDN